MLGLFLMKSVTRRVRVLRAFTWPVEKAERQRATEKKAPEIINDTMGPMFSHVLNHNFNAPSGSRLRERR